MGGGGPGAPVGTRAAGVSIGAGEVGHFAGVVGHSACAAFGLGPAAGVRFLIMGGGGNVGTAGTIVGLLFPPFSRCSEAEYNAAIRVTCYMYAKQPKPAKVE